MPTNAGQTKTDVLIIGAGIAGLACAIQLAREGNGTRQILVLEKSARLGGHLLSGAVLRPEALSRLLTPEELATVPLGPIVTRDAFHALTPRHSFRLPLVPPKMRMKGLPLVSVSALAQALGQVATALGVEILTAQAADSLIWEDGHVAGVHTQGDSIRATNTVLAEGPAGLLTREWLSRPGMRARNLQTHGLGLKELMEIPPDPGRSGTVVHTFGFPLDMGTYGGGFLYHLDDRHVALGFVVALDYTDPSLHPHDLFRKWKRHPLVQAHIAGGRTLEYGARLVPEGGWHSLPPRHSPGAWIIGDAAGLVDTMELKGLHLAMESGMATAHAILEGTPPGPSAMPSLDGLRRTANYRAAFRAGLPVGMAAAGLNGLTGGFVPWGGIAQRNERICLRPATNMPPPPDAADHGPTDLGLDSDLFLARLQVRAGPPHIAIRNDAVCRDCFSTFAAPCLRFCPAKVYESGTAPSSIRIRADNCLQCRCCILKCPLDNIQWETPGHGAGPDYARM